MIQGLPLSRVSEVVCGMYGIKRAELSRRGSRHPARAALAYLARRRTAATNAELAAKHRAEKAASGGKKGRGPKPAPFLWWGGGQI